MKNTKDERMKVSVIIPIYNAKKYLKRCLDSLIKQSFQDFEVIMVNDGSNDQSGDICYEYTIKDNRFKTINKNNEGVSAARNDGIHTAKGDWITFIDSDDYVCFDFLQNLVNASDEDTDFIQSGVNYVNDEGHMNKVECLDDKILNIKENPKDFFAQVTLPRITGPMAKLYKTSLIQEHNILFNPALSYGEDRDFNLRYMSYCQHTKSIMYVGYNYNIGNPNSLSKNKDYKRLLSIDLTYWDNLHKILNKRHMNEEIQVYLTTRLFNIINDRLTEIALYGNDNINKIIQYTFSSSQFIWLRNHLFLIPKNGLIKYVYAHNLLAIACLIYQLRRLRYRL